MTDNAPAKPRPVAAIAWTVAALVVTVISVGVVAAMGMSSESAGQMGATFAAFPVGFVLAGAVGAIAVHFLVPRPSPARIAAPLGCGCGGGLAMLTLVGLFFAVIFPAL